MRNEKSGGHLAALFTVTVWGSTYIFTKALLADFSPVEILLFRTLAALPVLYLFYPHPLKGTTFKQELAFATAGLCGVCLYYLLETIALDLTMASNVGVIVSTAPVFTALFLSKKEKLNLPYYIGFALAIGGIALISFNGSKLELNPAGDILALIAAVIWGFYSVVSRKTGSFGYNNVQVTRRIFCYGILFLIPSAMLFDFSWDLSRFASPVYLVNILYLGLVASALCFVTWNFSVRAIGAVKASVYIYLVPVISVVSSVLFLKERVTFVSLGGILLILTGLVCSEKRNTKG